MIFKERELLEDQEEEMEEEEVGIAKVAIRRDDAGVVGLKGGLGGTFRKEPCWFTKAV